MKIINSISNDFIKFAISLKNAGNQKKYSKYLIEGEKMTKLAFKLKETDCILITNQKYIKEFDNFDNIILINNNVAKKISSLVNHQGYFAICNIKQKNFDYKSNFLILDGVQDPGNMGTLLRSALAFGFKNIISTDNSVSYYNEKVLRATQSNHFELNLLTTTSLLETINILKNKDIVIFGTSLNKKNHDINYDVNKCCALILGNEGKGIDKSLEVLFDKNLIIKMENNVESLNVGVAGSILMKDLFYYKTR
ncbi:TrmH family RNA methyltransferase [Spiroplasma turonicum]|uniref:RNA methyltransferase, TrmH family n=1 Tax=Spiroplasma turonicum TaxID=216946 RepID=A0A0K1P580_9MOLU|nr:RNA methyltransferase [Spiroplasma turonicum]AKU79471.1 RNA methyltransferase, TrmH family [Spiroplasma turonicum]ALX70493.1 RNA methyltransferase, TrmH family [Spiroplasma turonicum]